jgi:hypothetical protein
MSYRRHIGDIFLLDSGLSAEDQPSKFFAEQLNFLRIVDDPKMTGEIEESLFPLLLPGSVRRATVDANVVSVSGCVCGTRLIPQQCTHL